MVEDNEYIKYILEDKSKYQTATEAGFYDPDNDWLIGKSGGFLPNMNFKFANIDKFTLVRNVYEETGKYIHAMRDSLPEKEFRIQEQYRRLNGMTIPDGKLIDGEYYPLRITGALYNFLNYGRIKRNYITDVIKSDKGLYKPVVTRKDGFPRFYTSHYWWAKAKEFAWFNMYHVLMAKSRRAGWSYYEAVDTANTLNLLPKSLQILAAADKKYLTQGDRPISLMVRNQLEFYDDYTPFKRGMILRDLENMLLGFKDKQGTNRGYLSALMSLSFANDPNVAAGKDARDIKIDELTNSPGLNAFLVMTEPTTRVDQIRTGMITGFGTGGGKATSMVEFERYYYNPNSFNFMPFENIWDDNARHTVCGYYKPYFESMDGIDIFTGIKLTDDNGNTNYEATLKAVELEREKERKNKSLGDFTKYISQYSVKPAESFSGDVSNILASPEMVKHRDQLKVNANEKFYIDGIVVKENKQWQFKSNEWLKLQPEAYLKEHNIGIHPYIETHPFSLKDDLHGCIRMVHPPIEVDGKVPDNLYRIWYDPFGIDKEEAELATRNSLGAFVVYMRVSNLGFGYGDIPVAHYAGRPNTMAELDKYIIGMSYVYNCQILAEIDRGEIIQNARAWNELHKLARQPIMSWDTSSKEKESEKYGISMSNPELSYKALTLFKEWLYTPRAVKENGETVYTFHMIKDLPTIEEFLKFNSTGNFDRISCYKIGMFDLADLRVRDIKIKVKKEHNPDSFLKRNKFVNR